MKKTYRLGELFCGPGGLACGALSATSSDGTLSVAHAWANDFDHDSCMTYRNNLCPSSPGSVVEGDVRDLDIPGLRSRFGNIDAFAYGFPCNSFSSLGKHNGIANKKFGQLYWYGVEVLREYQPDWFLAENSSLQSGRLRNPADPSPGHHRRYPERSGCDVPSPGPGSLFPGQHCRNRSFLYPGMGSQSGTEAPE